MSHYYTDNKDLSSNKKHFTYYFDNEVFEFATDNGVFSKKTLDYGSYLLIKNVYKSNLGKMVLDLGCGWGPVGIILKRFNQDIDVVAVDVNSRAIELAQENADLNKVETKTYLCEDIESLNIKFDSVILNPPIRAGKKIIYNLYQKSFNVLNDGGILAIVIQKKQGAESSLTELKQIFKNVSILEKDSGYYVIQAIKQTTH